MDNPQLPQESENQLFLNESEENELAVIDTFVGKNRVNEVVKSINLFLSAQAEAKIEKVRIEKLQVENQVKLAEIYKEQQKNEQTFISNFDFRSKGFSILAMLIVFGALFLFNYQGSVDKDFTKTIVTVITSIISIGGMNLVSEILSRNKKD